MTEEQYDSLSVSLPSRERGLKSENLTETRMVSDVAPFTGAWIEISSEGENPTSEDVAPFTGAWIEIDFYNASPIIKTVAPFTGAWIEIYRWEYT